LTLNVALTTVLRTNVLHCDIFCSVIKELLAIKQINSHTSICEERVPSFN